MREAEESEFTVLENKTIGRNFYKFRKLRERKAFEVADFLGIKEATYTKYERGESKITVDIIQKVSEFLKVDPIQMISTNADKHQTEVMMKMMETMMQMNEAIRKILEKE
jgi:transcriptional regulator with XRE-family HTH domain